MDPSNPFSSFFGNPGEPVPAVDPADMRAAYQMQKSISRPHGARPHAISVDVYKAVCSPQANIAAVSYRLMMIGLLEHHLEAAWSGGQLTDAALEVGATLPLEWMETGKPMNRFPLDLTQFVLHVSAHAQNLLPKPE